MLKSQTIPAGFMQLSQMSATANRWVSRLLRFLSKPHTHSPLAPASPGSARYSYAVGNKVALGTQQVLAAVRAAETELGPIDLAVANAGIAVLGASLPYSV